MFKAAFAYKGCYIKMKFFPEFPGEVIAVIPNMVSYFGYSERAGMVLLYETYGIHQ